LFSTQIPMMYNLNFIAVRVLNSIFQEWGISAPSAQWNISGQPCSGAAIGSIPIDNGAHNPFIKCDCSYDNNTTCHITALYVLFLLPVFALSLSLSLSVSIPFHFCLKLHFYT
jgi:hypothetical protein